MHAFLYKSKQSGSALVEFSIVAIPILGLLLSGIEISQWYFMRQALSLSLVEASRSAITNNNHPTNIINAFEHSLLPMYASRDQHGLDNSLIKLQQALNKREHDIQQPAWQIKVLSPSSSAFKDFHDKNINDPIFKGHAAINNNYLELQNTHGLGNASNQDIFQANTLTLSLTWQHKPVLPIITPILRLLGDKNGDYKQKALYKGYLPIQREISMIMQSHPVQWPSDASGKVIFDWDENKAVCKGWLCGLGLVNIDTTNNSINGSTKPNNYDNNFLNNYLDESLKNNEPTNENDTEKISDVLSDEQYQELCGVTLCCADWDND